MRPRKLKRCVSKSSNQRWLIVVDSQTGALGSDPLKSKGQLSLMAQEIMTFIQGLGHVEVGLYADNEPTMGSMLRIVLNSRHSMGLRTRLYTTKVRGSAGNSLAENAIQRVRGLACTLMSDVAESCKPHIVELGCQTCVLAVEPLPGHQGHDKLRAGTWEDLRRSSGSRWLRGVCLCSPTKGNPRWRMSIFLMKTDGQDAWIVGD